MRLSLILFVVFGLLLTSACQEETIDVWDSFQEFSTSYDPNALIKSHAFQSPAQALGEVNTILEASGLAKSYVNSQSLWTHNDSGNASILYLIDENTGSLKAGFRIEGLDNIDWEDIESGSGPKTGASYIYLGDIGDNDQNRTSYTIYRLEEPYYTSSYEGKIIDVDIKVDKINFTYPDGSHNAETLLLDPLNLDLYVVTKYGAKSMIYCAKYPQKDSVELIKVGEFPFREATGGNISENGNEIVIKTYDQIFYWQRKDRQPIWQTLAMEPTLLDYNPVEAKGEAICFANGGYYTLSEKYMDIIPVLHYYPNK